MTSGFAEAVLGLFIPLAIGIFFTMRPLTALLVVALGGEMFLPVGPSFKLPNFVAFTKVNLPYLCAFIGCALACPRRFKNIPKHRLMALTACLALLAGVFTGLTNGDVASFGITGRFVRPAMSLKDGSFVSVSSFFAPLTAFYLAYVLVRDAKDVERVLTGLAVAGLIYCPFAIVEMRMSPQFHYWIYGYSTGGFDETIRWGGYRPKIFMDHGLTLARFFLATLLALFVLTKRRRTLFAIPVRILAWFHFVVLILCRSTGAIVLGIVGYLVISFLKPKHQLLFAAALSLGTLLYPLLRTSNLFPTATVLETAGALNQDRSGSLAFRFRNEDLLLAHARKRLTFGWGTYGRNRVFDDNGNDIATTDGHWIIVLGSAGLTGFLIAFGPLVWPCVWARRRMAKLGTPSDEVQLAGLAVIVALTTVDLIPNGLWGVSQYLIAGVLMRGLVELRPKIREAAGENDLLRSGSRTSARA